jgi:hypothetical protein
MARRSALARSAVSVSLERLRLSDRNPSLRKPHLLASPGSCEGPRASGALRTPADPKIDWHGLALPERVRNDSLSHSSPQPPFSRYRAAPECDASTWVRLKRKRAAGRTGWFEGSLAPSQFAHLCFAVGTRQQVERCGVMPRFFFHLHNDIDAPDEKAQSLRTWPLPFPMRNVR